MKALVQSPNALGHALRSARLRKGMTQQELAEITGSSQPTLSQVERGEANLSLSTLLRILSALGLELILQDRSPVDVASTWKDFE